MQIKAIIIVTLGTILSNTVFAGTLGIPENPKTLIMTLSIGPLWTNTGQTQTFFLQPDIEKTYKAFNKNTTLFGGEFFAGMQRAVYPNILAQLGLAVAAATSTRLNGEIWEDADPDANNFFYKYRVNRTRLAVKGKLVLEQWQIFNPYLSGSLGLGFNRSHNFIIQSKLCEESPTFKFRSHSTTTLAYTLGAGLQKDLTNHWQVGVGYEFAAWGSSRLKHAPGQTLNSGLRLNHLNTNQLQFSISYLA